MVSLQHIHQHGLILVDTECIDASRGATSLIMCHNPLKKIQLLCNGCVRPITEMPFYKCGADDDESCNFALHEWCTRLPTQVDNHPGHPQHTLFLMSNVPRAFFNIFDCAVCCLPCNGYAYGCIQCNYYVEGYHQVNNEDLEESDEEEEDDLVTQDEFACTCKRASNNIKTHIRSTSSYLQQWRWMGLEMQLL
ncbi:hypothetical protein L1987_29462 [Smallanthus sonchifolius]|uniref:Uncharacterized protein n=1 Tax=Smallanthus sonchifolius TaxID=185202 RepID=A0ACB9I0V8_9ASTR|nr:hypothetical protein L1987_29462 [Smallanthus sonchifolius]